MSEKKDAPKEVIAFTLGDAIQEGKLLNLRRKVHGKPVGAKLDDVEKKRMSDFREEHTIRLNSSSKQKNRFAWLSKLLFWCKG